MVREPLTAPERERGERLGEVLRQARGSHSIVEVAAKAGISPETLRKIERGRIPTPAFFTVVAVADVLGVSLDALISQVTEPPFEAAARGYKEPVPAAPI
ncbi:helix-turn-helix transcriptional regulator [Actinomadura vinacea]|uniref:Helix-turn-helix transcriptional regulator n=1 Tax=Actinomadura vinacea TaxID=115336 RepID=A0ABN3ICR8_9ACTN